VAELRLVCRAWAALAAGEIRRLQKHRLTTPWPANSCAFLRRRHQNLHFDLTQACQA